MFITTEVGVRASFGSKEEIRNNRDSIDGMQEEWQLWTTKEGGYWTAMVLDANLRRVGWVAFK